MIVHSHLAHCVGVTTVAAIFEVTRERKLTSVSSLTRLLLLLSQRRGTVATVSCKPSPPASTPVS